MSDEVIFFNKVNQRRVQLSETGREGFTERAILYLRAAQIWAEALGIEGFPLAGEPVNKETVSKLLLELEIYMQYIEARNVRLIDRGLYNSELILNNDWKSHILTRLEHINRIVNDADIAENLRETILGRIASLRREVERNRTRFEAYTELWLSMTKAIGEGQEILSLR